MKIAVIGGSGFIGTELIKQLISDGHKVVIGDKNQSRSFPELVTICDVRSYESLIPVFEECELIYNLAAEHHDNVSPISLYYDVNVTGAENIIKAANQCGINNIIFTSTVAVYGFTSETADENHPINPFNHYGKSKAQAEDVFTKWVEADAERRLVVIRPAVVFGPGNRGNVYNLFKQVSSGFFPMIGNGENQKSMGYLENIAGLLKWGGTLSSGHHVFNWAEEPSLTMNDLVMFVKGCMGKPEKIPYFIGVMGGRFFDLISFVTRKKFKISYIRVRKFCENTKFSSTKAREAGFKESVTLKDGIKTMIDAEF